MVMPAFLGATTHYAGSGAQTVDVSGITAAGRQLWMAFRQANEPIAAWSGWTEISDTAWGTGTAGGTDATGLQLFAMDTLADGSETTIALPDAGAHNLAFAFATDPAAIDVLAVTSGAYTTSPVFPSVTTTGPDRLILLLLSNDSGTDSASGGSAPTNANLANLTERFDRRSLTSSPSSRGGGLWMVTGEKATAGAIGTTSGTYASSASGAVMVMATIALKEPGGSGDTITGGKAGATASARDVVISAETVISAGKATAAAAAHAAVIQTGVSVLLGKASATAQARSAAIMQTTALTLGKASASAQAFAATVTGGIRITGGKAIAAASALALNIVQTTSLALGKAIASAQARAASISDGSAPAAGSLTGGLIVNVGRLLSRF